MRLQALAIAAGLALLMSRAKAQGDAAIAGNAAAGPRLPSMRRPTYVNSGAAPNAPAAIDLIRGTSVPTDRAVAFDY